MPAEVVSWADLADGKLRPSAPLYNLGYDEAGSAGGGRGVRVGIVGEGAD